MFRAGMNKDLRKRERRVAQKAKVREFNKNNMGFLRREIAMYEKYNGPLPLEEKVQWLRAWRNDPLGEARNNSRKKFFKLRDSFPEVGEFSD